MRGEPLRVCRVQGRRGAEWPGQGAVPPCPSLPSAYPVRDVVKAVWAGDVEAEEQDAGVRVEQRPQAVVVDLSWVDGAVVTPSRSPAPLVSTAPTSGRSPQPRRGWVCGGRDLCLGGQHKPFHCPWGRVPWACLWDVPAPAWVRALAERALFWREGG